MSKADWSLCKEGAGDKYRDTILIVDTIKNRPGSKRLLRELAEFRYVVRNFLHFSEEAAARHELPAQQHQLLLQVEGAAEGVLTTIAYLAERLALRHHSVVELALRCEAAGLIVRNADAHDRRLTVLEVTEAGRRVLGELADDHARELNDLLPRLLETLSRIRELDRRAANAGGGARPLKDIRGDQG